MRALCRDELRSNLSLIGTAIEAGVVRSRTAAARLGASGNDSVPPSVPTNSSVVVPILSPFLFFALRYRDVQSRTVNNAVRSVDKGFDQLGAQDPRPKASGSIVSRLQHQIGSCATAETSLCPRKTPPSLHQNVLPQNAHAKFGRGCSSDAAHFSALIGD
mgnify:CR=1 FL=1